MPIATRPVPPLSGAIALPPASRSNSTPIAPICFRWCATSRAGNFPTTTCCICSTRKGKAIVEFSEVEDGIFEAPTPGVGVLFLQNAAAAAAPPKPAEQIAGDWAIVRKSGAPVCTLTLSMTKAGDGFAVYGQTRAAIRRLRGSISRNGASTATN